MFAGIVTDIGTLRDAAPRRLVIATRYDLATVALGASIACAGVCLTVAARERDAFVVDVSAETLARTTIGGWREGRGVNLERALGFGDEVGGHLVSGHVDGLATLEERDLDGDALRMRFRAPLLLMPMIAVKGAVALDGVSLTVNEVGQETFGVTLIPHTIAQTTLGDLRLGDVVNLEVDMLARYVARLMQSGSLAGGRPT